MSYLNEPRFGMKWSSEGWESRCKIIARVWDRKSEQRKKMLLSKLVAHAPEAI